MESRRLFHKIFYGGPETLSQSPPLIRSSSDMAEQAIMLEPTKRSVVSLIGRFYDPLGFMAPIVVRFKVFMQSLFETKTGWDKAVPDSLMDQWRKLVSALLESQPMDVIWMG